MSGFLNSSEIERMFERASDGQTPVENEARRGRRARWLRTVDFTRPTKFSTDQERRIRRTLDTFCERVPTRMAAEHRTLFEFEVIDVVQYTWTDAFGLVPEESVYMTLDTNPHPGRMLLTCELPVILIALNRMLGGRDKNIKERELTDIDLMVVERLFSTMVAELSQAFFDISEMTFGISNVDTQSETVQVAAGSEPTLQLTLEVRLENTSATMGLLIPHQAIAPVSHAFSRRDDGVTKHDPAQAAQVRRGLSLVDVTVRAEVADTTLSIADVLALQPGDVIRLDAEADTDVTLYVDRTAIHTARAGRSGKFRAAQVTSKVEPKP
ncbi:MAG: FliM/FliN family flagellar motor switch protein [Baekduia sp.]